MVEEVHKQSRKDQKSFDRPQELEPARESEVIKDTRTKKRRAIITGGTPVNEYKK